MQGFKDSTDKDVRITIVHAVADQPWWVAVASELDACLLVIQEKGAMANECIQSLEAIDSASGECEEAITTIASAARTMSEFVGFRPAMISKMHELLLNKSLLTIDRVLKSGPWAEQPKASLQTVMDMLREVNIVCPHAETIHTTIGTVASALAGISSAEHLREVTELVQKLLATEDTVLAAGGQEIETLLAELTTACGRCPASVVEAELQSSLTECGSKLAMAMDSTTGKQPKVLAGVIRTLLGMLPKASGDCTLLAARVVLNEGMWDLRAAHSLTTAFSEDASELANDEKAYDLVMASQRSAARLRSSLASHKAAKDTSTFKAASSELETVQALITAAFASRKKALRDVLTHALDDLKEVAKGGADGSSWLAHFKGKTYSQLQVYAKTTLLKFDGERLVRRKSAAQEASCA